MYHQKESQNHGRLRVPRVTSRPNLLRSISFSSIGSTFTMGLRTLSIFPVILSLDSLSEVY